MTSTKSTKLFTTVDEKTYDKFEEARIAEGGMTPSSFLRIVIERYFNNSVEENNHVVSRDRVSKNYMAIMEAMTQQSEEIKLLTSLLLISWSMQIKNSGNQLNSAELSEALHKAASLADEEIEPAVLEKLMNDIFKSTVQAKPKKKTSDSDEQMQLSLDDVNSSNTSDDNSESEQSDNYNDNEFISIDSEHPDSSDSDDADFDDDYGEDVETDDTQSTYDSNVLTVSNFKPSLIKSDEANAYLKKMYEQGIDADAIPENMKREIVFYETHNDYPACKALLSQGYNADDSAIELVTGVQNIKEDLQFKATGTRPISYTEKIDIPSFLNKWSDSEGRFISPDSY